MDYVKGLVLMASLVVLVGPVNLHVMRHGLQKKNLLTVVLGCIVGCGLMAVLGIAGVGVLLENYPVMLKIIGTLGIVLLLYYAFVCLRRVYRNDCEPKWDDVAEEAEGKTSIKMALFSVGLVLLNPLAYLEYLVVLGGFSGSIPTEEKWNLYFGALTSIVVWFFLLGYGMRLISPWFKNKNAWRGVDVVTVLLMVYAIGTIVVDVYL